MYRSSDSLSSSSSPPFAPLAPALASLARPEPATEAKSQRKNSLLWSRVRSRVRPRACLLIDSDGSRYANERRHFLCDTEPGVGIRPIRTFFLTTWVGLGGTCLVNNCVAAKTIWSSLILSSFHLIFVPELARAPCSLEVSESLCQ